MIIVTGGAGFIGRNLIKRLNKIQQTNILVVDNLKKGIKYINLVNLNITDYIDKSDFIQKLTTGSYYRDIKAIFHEGACSSTNEWNGEYIMKNNYQYSKDLLTYCVTHKIPFIYASSAAIYGRDMNICNKINNYNYHSTPLNIYSYSKLLFDQYVYNILPKTKSQICGLRYFNVYGPYESHKENMASIIYNLYKQIKNKKKPTLFTGSKNFKRDFIYIDDIININLWVWNNNISGIFDCGTGLVESFEYVANTVLNFFNKKTIQYVPMPQNLQKHYQFFTKSKYFSTKKCRVPKTIY